MFPMEFYFPQICGKLIPAVALDWTDFGGICFLRDWAGLWLYAFAGSGILCGCSRILQKMEKFV